jgi:hypothetical protein
MPECQCRNDNVDYWKNAVAGLTLSPAFRHLLKASEVFWFFPPRLSNQLEELPWGAEGDSQPASCILVIYAAPISATLYPIKLHCSSEPSCILLSFDAPF